MGLDGGVVMRFGRRSVRAAAIAAVVAWPATAIAATATTTTKAAPGDPPRALIVRYADGRTVHQLIRPEGGSSWTPLFPRVPGAETARNGLPLTALELRDEPADHARSVTVSLLYGSPHQDRVIVATVSVGGEPVRVEELTAFGVRPITLAIADGAPAPLSLPSVSSPSSELEASVEVISDDAPGYQMRLVNRSPRAVIGFEWTSYRGPRPASSSARRGRRGAPLILPGEAYAFTLPAGSPSGRGSAPPAWTSIDRVVITSVVWSDGVIEGDPEYAAVLRALTAGTARQIVRLLALERAAIRDPLSQSPAKVRADIAALPIAVTEHEAAELYAAWPDQRGLDVAGVRSSIRLGMQQAKDIVIADLDAFVRAAPADDVAGFARWLAAGVADLEAWLARIGDPGSPK
jgi:hypothetical protein